VSDHHKSHDTLHLPTSLGKLRNFITAEEEDYIPPRSARLTTQTARNKSNFQTPRTRSPAKIVDSVAVGLGPNNHIELDQNEVKEGLKKVKEKTIVEHRSQNMKLAIPSGRKEVIALSGWLNNMLEGIYKEEEIKTEKVFEDVQLIYTACLQEIIRQVKVQCGERGQLLEKIWEAYIDIFDKVIREEAKVRREIEKEHLNEMEEVSKVYQKRLELMEYEMNLVKKERTEVKETLEKRKEEIVYLKKKVEKQDGQLMSHKDLVEEVRDEMDRVKNENAELRRLVLESEVQIQKRYVEIQKNISERYEMKRAEAHKRKPSEPDRIKNRIYDPMRDHNLNENLNMMDKLDDVIEGFAIRDQEDIEERSPRGVVVKGEGEKSEGEEDLYKEIGVDTEDLVILVEEVERMDQEVQCDDIEIVTPVIVVEQVKTMENKQEEEEFAIKEEKSSQEDTSSSSSDSSDDSSDDSSSSKKSKESNAKMEEMMKELGKKRIYDKINKLTKSESYKILSNVERKLYEKVSQEEDGDMKTNLINVLGMMIRQEIGLENEDYQDLVTRAVEKNIERGEPPSEDLAEVLEAVKEMNKDELLEVLGLLQKRWHKEGEGKVKEVKESDDLMRFMVEILKGSETVEIKNKELGNLLLKVKQLQSKRQERLNFMDTMEQEAQKTAKEAADEAEKVNFLEEMKRRLNGTIGVVGINGLNRELVNILERNVSDRGDLAQKDLKELLNNALGALDKTLVQITALKVENQEQNIDIQELNEVKETQDQHVARLEKEVTWVKDVLLRKL